MGRRSKAAAPIVPTLARGAVSKLTKTNGTAPVSGATASSPSQYPLPLLPTEQEVLDAEARCWDPTDAEQTPFTSSLDIRVESLALEIARAKGVRQLRLALGEAVRALHLDGAAAVGSFERWHFGWLSSASAPGLDPLLPATSAPLADATLAAELQSAGADAADASRTIETLRRAATREASTLASLLQSASAPDLLAPSEAVVLREAPDHSTASPAAPSTASTPASSSTPSLWHVVAAGLESQPLKISDDQLCKLRALHAHASGAAASGAVASGAEVSDAVAAAAAASGAAAAAASGAGAADGNVPPVEVHFRHALARLLLRYKTVGGAGFQAALGGGAFAVLRRAFGCRAECFASPLNARAAPFCSAFEDVDASFGSLGSFFRFAPREGCYQANPPFAPALIGAMAEHMERLLRAAQAANKPLLFAVVVGASASLRRHEAWRQLQRLASGPFGRAQWLVPLHAHGYTDGHAHIVRGGTRAAKRLSSCDTAVFIFATSEAAARWPATPQAEACLREAMRATVPRKIKQRASKANKAAHAAKKRKRVAAGAEAGAGGGKKRRRPQ